MEFMIKGWMATLLFMCMLAPGRVAAQTPAVGSVGDIATQEASTATVSAEERKEIKELEKEDVTQPEEEEVREEVIALFNKRPVNRPGITNFLEYSVQFAVREGVPANTVILILLLPLLASIVAFVRHVIGLPGFDLLVPIAFAITFIATGITTALILLMTILIASFIGRIVLKPIRIMYLPKVAMSILIVCSFVFAVLTVSAFGGILAVKKLSIFPVLLLILLSENITKLQLQRNMRDTLYITGVTVGMGILGFGILSSQMIRNFILLYPEILLFLVPVNIIIGRYFGLRLSEYFRFIPLFEKKKEK